MSKVSLAPKDKSKTKSTKERAKYQRRVEIDNGMEKNKRRGTNPPDMQPNLTRDLCRSASARPEKPLAPRKAGT